MKNTCKILTIVAMLLGNTIAATSQTLDEMPQEKRDSLLISIAKEVIMKYGPDYYREYKPPVIKRFTYPYEDSDKGKNQGRIMYSVIIYYDTDREKLELGYAAAIGIWNDTKQPHGFRFGNGWHMDIPEDRDWRNDNTIEQIPYQQIEVWPRYEFRPDNTYSEEPENIQELLKRGYEKHPDGEWRKKKKEIPPRYERQPLQK